MRRPYLPQFALMLLLLFALLRRRLAPYQILERFCIARVELGRGAVGRLHVWVAPCFVVGSAQLVAQQLLQIAVQIHVHVFELLREFGHAFPPRGFSIANLLQAVFDKLFKLLFGKRSVALAFFSQLLRRERSTA